MKKGERGAALILVLMAVAIVTAVTVEFVSNVHVSTEALENWKASARLSLASKSGASVASRILVDNLSPMSYSYPASFDFPPEKPFMESDLSVSIHIEDESAKLNLNEAKNENVYNILLRLFDKLGIKGETLDKIADWVDKDEIPRAADSEKYAKNGPLDSLEEILQIPGIDESVYAKLIPYATVYGDHQVNINSAPVEVLMALDPAMTDSYATRIASYRDSSPFQSPSDLQKVSGLGTLATGLLGKIKVKGNAFSITSTAQDGRIKRIVRCIVDQTGLIKFWQEI